MLDVRLMNETRSHRVFLCLLFLSSAVQGLLIAGGAYAAAWTINAVFLLKHGLKEVAAPLTFLLLCICLRPTFLFIGEFTARRLSLAVKDSLRQRLTRHALYTRDPIKQESSGKTELMHTLSNGIEDLDAYFSIFLPQLFAAAVIPAVILVTAACFDLKSALILFFTAPLIPLFMFLIGKRTESARQKQWETLTSLSMRFLDVLEGLPVLKLFGQARLGYRALRRTNEQFRIAALSVLKIAFTSALTLELTATLSIALIAVTIGLRLLDGQIEFFHAMLLLLLAPEFYQPLRGIGAAFHSAIPGIAAADAIYANLPKETAVFHNGQTKPSFPFVHLEVQNISFTYPGQAKPIIQNLSFTLRPGERLAIVGASGAGKTTLLHLLLGILQPQSGKITVNGQPLSAIDLTAYRSSLSYIGQKPHIFSATVQENILLGYSNAIPEEVCAAAQKAAAHDFIRQLPAGYHTEIGDGRFGLSSGQKQRIALARVFLRNAPLILLDEPTARLDLTTEKKICAALETFLKGRTLLVISHRPNVAGLASRLLFMEQGTVKAAGTHDELLKRSSAYKNFYQSYGGTLL